ncbi:MAG: AsmA-like C-terminal region-containing protein [Alphaproteobacteria bacterium]
MRLKIPFFSFAIAIAGIFFTASVFAVFIPHIVDSEPVRARLLKELHKWTGGDVTLTGPVTVSSFFSVAVEAQDLHIDRPKKLSRITSISAGKIVARLSWMALIKGEVDFDKVKIQNAEIGMKSADTRETLNAMLNVLSAPRRAPFGTLRIDDSILTFHASPEHPGRRVNIESVILSYRSSGSRISVNGDLLCQGQQLGLSLSATTPSQPQNGNSKRTPISLQVKAPLLDARFDGEVDFSRQWNATGSIDAQTPDMAKLSTWLGGVSNSIPPEALSVKASLKVANKEINLQDAEFSLGAQTATGNLNIAFQTPQPGEEAPGIGAAGSETPGASGPEVEGSLAFSSLHLDSFFTNGTRPPQAIRSIASDFSQVDLRISADSLRWQNFETGEAAFTLSARSGVISLEVAELVFLDGSARGQIVADTSVDPIQVQARLSVEELNANSLLAILKQRDWLTGRANADIEAEMVWGGARPFWETAEARVSVAFTDGGQIRLDIPRLADTVTGSALNGWDGIDFTSADFNELRFKLILRNGLLTCDNVELSSADDIVNGTGSIDFPKGSLNWRFSVSPRAPGDDFTRTIRRSSVGFRPGLSIKGAIMHPTFSTARLTDNAPADPPKAIGLEETPHILDVPVVSAAQSNGR